jgi:hypothetical protein
MNGGALALFFFKKSLSYMSSQEIEVKKSEPDLEGSDLHY